MQGAVVPHLQISEVLSNFQFAVMTAGDGMATDEGTHKAAVGFVDRPQWNHCISFPFTRRSLAVRDYASGSGIADIRFAYTSFKRSNLVV
jgi:hypothetical protein